MLIATRLSTCNLKRPRDISIPLKEPSSSGGQILRTKTISEAMMSSLTIYRCTRTLVSTAIPRKDGNSVTSFYVAQSRTWNRKCSRYGWPCRTTMREEKHNPLAKVPMGNVRSILQALACRLPSHLNPSGCLVRLETYLINSGQLYDQSRRVCTAILVEAMTWPKGLLG